ncbi:MAG: hypothetical protein GC159_06300 [Phycisphaera sp.]|nr:hypothetical protein [Phycisphaera sp.]
MSRDAEHPELAALLKRLCDGELSDAEFARLDELMSGNAAAQELYVDIVTTHQMLAAMTNATSGPIPLEAAEAIRETTEDPFDLRAHGGRGGSVYRYAAAAVFLLCAGLAVYGLSRPQRPSGDPLAYTHAGGDADVSVATFTEAMQAEWADDSAPDPGAALTRGALRLKSGAAEVMMASTASVTLVGAVDVEIVGPNRCRLNRGRLVAAVPPLAHGFTVETPSHEVVDLGTRFAVTVDAAGETRVHVAQGRVTVKPLGGDDASVVTLTKGQAVRASADAPTPQAIAFDPGAQLPRETRVTHGGRIVEADPPMLLIDATDHAVDSVVSNATELDDALLVVVERAKARLANDLPVTFTEPGEHTRFVKGDAVIPAGTSFRCYYVQFDPIDGDLGASRVSFTGTLRFRDPVLGVIADDTNFAASSPRLKREDMTYPGARAQYLALEGQETRGVGRNEPADVVTLSPDRRTLTLKLGVVQAADRLRVITAARPPEN